MFILFVIYFICIFFIWWSYAGYIFYLFVYYVLRRGGIQEKTSKSNYPSLSVIVPVFEEEKLIGRKIQNLKKLVYSGRAEFLLIDGGSTDKTIPIIKRHIKNLSKFRLLTAPRGKINQLNRGLAAAKGKIIVCTDVDAILPKNALKTLASYFIDTDSKVGLVGAYVLPKSSALEREYWQEQNQLRLIESKVYSASIIVGPCYAFRRSLLKNFPDDCVADDVYISFYAQSKDFLVKYAAEVTVYELRAPKDLVEFFTHKFRKANAYITELLRFVYTINKFNIRSKIIFLSRFSQIIILPWISLFFLAISLNLFIVNNAYRLAVIFTLLFLIINIFIAALLFNIEVFSLKVKVIKNKIFNFRIFLYTNIILFFAIFTYFFYKQDSSYEKIRVK